MQPALLPAPDIHHKLPMDSPEYLLQRAMIESARNAAGGDPDQAEHDQTSADGSKRGNKRELSTSKRAAQNRAAQRAFRQRKEGHIKKLEEQVRDYQALAESYKQVQAENYQLRDYIINLQSRLIESQGDFPPAPGNIDLAARPPVLDDHIETGAVEGDEIDIAGQMETDGIAAAESALDLVQEANIAVEAANASANATAALAAGQAGKNGIVDPTLNRS